MKRNFKTALVFIIPIGIILLIILGSYFARSARDIPLNPADLAGNTAGNLFNGGTFCEQDGRVYFANPYDNGSIYSMTPQQGDVKKVVTANASCINVAGDYIYYYSSSSAGQSGLGYIRDGRGIYRVDTSGSKNILLNHLTSDGMVLLGNCLFYTDFAGDESGSDAKVTLNGMTLEGNNDTLLIPDHVKPGCSAGTSVFFAGMSSDHHLHELDTQSGNITEASTHNMYEPIIDGDYLYFLDMDDNMSLKRMHTDSGELFTISSERIETINLSGDYIYYQTIDTEGGNAYAFKRIHTDGSGEEVIKEGVVSNIQLTSAYAYFTEYGYDTPIYQFPVGGGSITVFQAAIESVKISE